MIVLTCPKTGGKIGVHPNHIASVAPDRRPNCFRTVIALKGGGGIVIVAESSAEVLAAIEQANQKKGEPKV